MYETFYNLKEEPFGMAPNPRFLFLSKKHDEALTSISYGVDRRKGFILITGEIGTGKTTICRALLNRLRDVDYALILNPSMIETELLAAIVEDFGINAREGIKDNIDSLNRFLLERRAKGKNAVLVIDESQSLSKEALEMIRLLSNLETETEKLLQIVLMGQPELREKLESRELRQLNQRIAVRYHLEPLDRFETKGYVFHRIKVAGGSGRYIKFTDGATDRIYDFTKGYPRLINILCDRVLMAGYVEEKRVIDEGLVLKSNQELGIKSV
jgi:general secretion pathway protein A